jgi:hypothetical protein
MRTGSENPCSGKKADVRQKIIATEIARVGSGCIKGLWFYIFYFPPDAKPMSGKTKSGPLKDPLDRTRHGGKYFLEKFPSKLATF